MSSRRRLCGGSSTSSCCGRKAIAECLNREGVSCRSAHSPRQNSASEDGRLAALVHRGILENPRYTGCAIYGRWQKVEELLDPEDVAAGYVMKFRRSPQAKIVRSRQLAHPAIVPVETLLLRSSSGAAGSQAVSRPGRPMTGRTDHPVSGSAADLEEARVRVSGRIRCGICVRTMEGAARREDTIYYRSNARTLVPGSATAMDHPRQIYLREDLITPHLNRWIGRLFDPIHRSEPITALLEADDSADELRDQIERLRDPVAAAETVLEVA
ncbi:hypothetical protein [Kribbella speibonae]|uniref:Recombinase domain-containing protein n=1 Tax=Kribbella speibonae TaxID=1572660 RepID=A0ABY2A8U5_9ACTN|nr:hypothetical protein [Kribbella speibonae]TCC25393.1 hypothetical protein E0H58_14670 [Kribbella speibonae]